ncbi:uncharacterized protein [Montipora capricornis]|uniref:uncharacterized protein n=1 Tax=Montipora capricornis TaxID=246305 RepID=UPI0035F13E88
MELYVKLNCLDSGKTECIKVALNEWDHLCVKNLKKILEDEIRVPLCDQVLSYQGRQLNDDSFPLKKLYFRQGDTVSVSCSTQGNILDMKSFLQEIKDFAKEINNETQSELLTVSLNKDFRTSYVSYDNIARALENLSFNFFIPWKNAQSVVHRHYFVQEGGFDAFMEVLKFSGKRYRMEEKPHSRKLLGKLKDKDFCELAEELKELNNEQMVLQMHCLSLLWNFSETLHDRRLVLQKGGLQLVMKALLLDPNAHSLPSDEYFEVASINETAVGCLVQYAEFPDCQEVISQSPDTVAKLMFMVGSHFQSFSSTHIPTYNTYSAQIAANTLFCCACSLRTPKILVESGMHKRMINLVNLLPDGDLALSYYCTLFLARTRASALVCMDPQTAECIDKIIAAFLAKHKPDDVSKWEENHNYVWVSLTPFVSLAFSGRQVTGCTNSFLEIDCKKQKGEDKNECQATWNGIQDDVDGPNLLSEKGMINDMSDADMQLGSHAFPDKKTGLEKPVQGTGNLDSTAGGTTGDHSLSGNVTENKQRTMLGSKQTQKLGLFTLQHMLTSSGNQQLVKSERLLPYLDCLCGHISDDDAGLLKAQLRKYWSPSPASLSVICKSSLAFMLGFESALKM